MSTRNLFSSPLQGRTVLIFIVVTNVIYFMMILWTIPYVMSFADGLQILDMRPLGYNQYDVNQLMNELGIAGRSAYLYRQIPLDMIYPFLFGLSYYLLLTWLLTKLYLLSSRWALLIYLPIIAALFDYLENIGIIFLLDTHPDYSAFEVSVFSFFSVVKSSFSMVYFVSLIIFLLIFLWKKWILKSN